MNMATIFDKVIATFADCKIGTIFSRADIINVVHKEQGVNTTSIIPSDYCYNLTNVGKEANSRLSQFFIFEYLCRGQYKYLGQNYPYTGKVYHSPKGENQTKCIGEWKNGIFYCR